MFHDIVGIPCHRNTEYFEAVSSGVCGIPVYAVYKEDDADEFLDTIYYHGRACPDLYCGSCPDFCGVFVGVSTGEFRESGSLVCIRVMHYGSIQVQNYFIPPTAVPGKRVCLINPGSNLIRCGSGFVVVRDIHTSLFFVDVTT